MMTITMMILDDGIDADDDIGNDGVADDYNGNVVVPSVVLAVNKFIHTW